ncbi:MAG TPA: M23 family metallopeptidase [Sphingomicrobium sp.]|nr:M23 family metallopeptidase [Sphingomicrobium sp.]
MARALPRPDWRAAGVLALLCSGVAWASLPKPVEIRSDERLQWQALAIAPLSRGGETGMRMDATGDAEPIAFVPVRKVTTESAFDEPQAPRVAAGPIRIRGRVNDGLYWSLRSAGASPQVAAQYLAALATQIDVGGDVSAGDGFDMVLGGGGALLYAGLDRVASSDLQLVKWNSSWIDAAGTERPAPVSTAMAWPVAGRITSYFGYRYHPILHFSRFHAGLDFGASWGSPIVAAADGQVVRAGWAGGYGRQVRIAHGAGLVTSYSHMSQIVAEPGSFVRQGQLIGYVGSSGLSTGPHLHYEVLSGGRPVNPLSVRFASAAPVTDARLADAVKARLRTLLSVGVKRS